MQSLEEDIAFHEIKYDIRAAHLKKKTVMTKSCISDEKVEQIIQGNWVLENRDLFRSVQNSLSTELIFESYINQRDLIAALAKPTRITPRFYQVGGSSFRYFTIFTAGLVWPGYFNHTF